MRLYISCISGVCFENVFFCVFRFLYFSHIFGVFMKIRILHVSCIFCVSNGSGRSGGSRRSPTSQVQDHIHHGPGHPWLVQLGPGTRRHLNSVFFWGLLFLLLFWCGFWAAFGPEFASFGHRILVQREKPCIFDENSSKSARRGPVSWQSTYIRRKIEVNSMLAGRK